MPPTPPPGVSELQDEALETPPNEDAPKSIGPEDEDRRLRKGEKLPDISGATAMVEAKLAGA